MERKGSRSWARTAVAAAASLVLVATLGACGKSEEDPGAASLQDALGFDEDDFEAREAKVQEEIRRCMQVQGFDYVPVDASQMNIRVAGPGTEDNAEFRRTKGYGVTTQFGQEPVASGGGGSDANEKIREGLDEADRKAYDIALFGSASEHVGGGDFTFRVGPGSPAGGVEQAGEPQDAGCFGQAQEKVGERGGGVRKLGPKLQELEQRITSDPRMVKANTAWSACMSDAGFDYRTPDEIVPYLFGRLQELQGQLGTGEGLIATPSAADSPELEALRSEELAIAKADDQCSRQTGRPATVEKVRREEERRFLEENPDLGADDGGER